MPSALSAVPASRRLTAAAVAGAAAILLLVVGLLPWVLDAPLVVRILATVCLVAGGAVGLVAWGLARSVRVELADAVLDAAIADITGSCDCGHDHTPPTRSAPVAAADPAAADTAAADTAAACAQDCAGTSCASCVLSRP